MKKNKNIIILGILFLLLSSFKTLPKTKKLVINSGYKIPSRPGHKGVDYQASTGTKIIIKKTGQVTRTETNCRVTSPRTTACGGGWGNFVEIEYKPNVKVIYAHLSQVNVTPGEKVKAGKIIGLTGDTGNSRGAHLHFEYKVNNVNEDPTPNANDYFGLI